MRLNDFQLTENFNLKEFECPCCHTVLLHPLLVLKLQKLRDEWGLPLIINSGYRCEVHNREVGGVIRSLHKVGQAADVTVLSTGKMLTGTITRIAQEATVSGDLAYYEVTMTVPQDGTLAMGLSCEIRVLYQSVKNVTTVSIDAIQYDSDGKPFVYCYDRKDDIVQQRVTLGINNGSIVEIVDGIRTGEAVLIPVKNTMEMPMMHY